MRKRLGELLIAAGATRMDGWGILRTLRAKTATRDLSILAVTSLGASDADRARPRILIVEDNLMNMELMTELLERGGYELCACNDGREVMRQAKTHRPDLILLDINLPHMDGLTLTRMLREDPETRSAAIVAVSAYSVAGDEERIRQAGCDGFIPKPIDTKRFLQTVSTYLDRGHIG